MCVAYLGRGVGGGGHALRLLPFSRARRGYRCRPAYHLRTLRHQRNFQPPAEWGLASFRQHGYNAPLQLCAGHMLDLRHARTRQPVSTRHSTPCLSPVHGQRLASTSPGSRTKALAAAIAAARQNTSPRCVTGYKVTTVHGRRVQFMRLLPTGYDAPCRESARCLE